MMSRIGLRVAILICLLLPPGAFAQDSSWHFAVSGDSRNCGDVVMPAIAAGANRHEVHFYWHLGDLRAMYDFDQDMLARGAKPGEKRSMTIGSYQGSAWDDFIQRQIGAWGKTPVFVGIGNHELYPPRDRNQFLVQFADWINSPVLRQQRLADDPADHRLHTWFHWIERGVDFIYLDNVSNDQFESGQVAWFERVLKRDHDDASVKSVVVGTHVPLPDGLSYSHSMNDWPLGEQSGRRVYQDLVTFRGETHKNVYVLSSHSHFYMAGVYDSEYLRAHGGVLPGWIVGTAGAVRYALPPLADKAQAAKTNVYGYLLGTVAADGSIKFEFQEVKEADVPPAVASQYAADALHECYVGNTAVR